MTRKTINLLRSVFAKDEAGNTYIRFTGSSFEADELENAVTPRKNRDLDTLLSSCIVLDASGKPALRLASVPFGSTVHDAARKIREAGNDEEE